MPSIAPGYDGDDDDVGGIMGTPLAVVKSGAYDDDGGMSVFAPPINEGRPG